MKVLEKIQIIPKKKNLPPKVQALILKVSPNKNSYNGEILGRSLVDWVAFACNEISKKVIEYDTKSNLISIAKDYIDRQFDYTLILLSSTPLITNETVNSIIEYATIKEINCCKLPVGYIVNNKYILETEIPEIDSVYSQSLEDFYVVENKKQYARGEEVLQDRINSFHIDNGVDIKRSNTVYIEPEVDIAKGVTIFGGNTLRGNTIICNGVILKENNVITNSKIGENSCVSGSFVENSTLGSNVYVSTFCSVVNSIVGQDVIVNSSCSINNTTILSKTKINANTVLGETNDSNSGIGKSR